MLVLEYILCRFISILYYSETFKLDDKNYPVASAAFPRLMSLPIYPGMTDQSVEKVINTLIEILNKYRR